MASLVFVNFDLKLDLDIHRMASESGEVVHLFSSSTAPHPSTDREYIVNKNFLRVHLYVTLILQNTI